MNTCYVVGCNVQNLYSMWYWMLLNVILYQPGKFFQRKIRLVKQKLSSCSICCVNKIAMYFLHEFYGLFWAVMVILKNGLELLKFDGLYFFGIHINGRVWARKYSGLKNGPLQWPSLKKKCHVSSHISCHVYVHVTNWELCGTIYDNIRDVYFRHRYWAWVGLSGLQVIL